MSQKITLLVISLTSFTIFSKPYKVVLGNFNPYIDSNKTVTLYEKPSFDSRVITHLHETKRIIRLMKIAEIKVSKGFLKGTENPWCYVYEYYRKKEGWTKDINPNMKYRKVNFFDAYIEPRISREDENQLKGVWVRNLNNRASKTPYYEGKKYNYVGARGTFTKGLPVGGDMLHIDFQNKYVILQYFDSMVGSRHVLHYLEKTKENEYYFYVKGTFVGTTSGRIKVNGDKLSIKFRFTNEPKETVFRDFSGNYTRVTDSKFILKNYNKNKLELFSGSMPPPFIVRAVKNNISVHEKPSSKSKVLKILRKDEIVERLGLGKHKLTFETRRGEEFAWLYYETKGLIDGYIWGGDIKRLIYYVKINQLNLKNKPNSKARTIAKVNQGKYVQLIKISLEETIKGKKGKWYFVKVLRTGKTGYVFRPYLK